MLGHYHESDDYVGDGDEKLSRKIWVESKKLWVVTGPAIFSLIAFYSTFLVGQISAGRLGELELAAMGLSCNVIIGLDFGLMLGMANAFETLCGQAFGAKNYGMLGVYLQRSWIILFGCSVLLLPLFIFATPILKVLGQPADVAELAGVACLSFIPLHFSFAFQFPLQRFLQCQLKNRAIAWVYFVALIVHLFLTWLLVIKLEFGLIGIALTLSCSWWIGVFGLLGYTLFGPCSHTWTGFSIEAFSGLWEFLKLSVSSGVMLSLEYWYYQILIIITGNLKNSKVDIDALSICLDINTWENMFPLGFLIGVGVRVANELGEGNGEKAKFATLVALSESILLSVVFGIVIFLFHNELAVIFSSSEVVVEGVNDLSVLLIFTVILNSVQPILSGVAIGSGWQDCVAWINLGCYYLLGLPTGLILKYVFNQGVKGIWSGMLFGGTAIQTVILMIVTIRSDWKSEATKAKARVEKWAVI